MNLFIASALCITLAQLGGAQTTPVIPAQSTTQTKPARPKQDILPQTTLYFQPVGDGLPLPDSFAAINHPVCGGDGTYYMNAEVLPSGERQVVAISPADNGKVSRYTMASITGLVNVSPRLMDAQGPDLYVLVEAAKTDDLFNHDVKPGSAEAWKYAKNFILHFHGEPASPDVIQLDLPFFPEQFAATSDGKFVFLGLNRANQSPVLAVIDGSGDFDHYIDAYQDFGSEQSIVNNAPQRLKSQYKTMPEGAPLEFALVAAQFVHYRDSLLLLMPGSKPKILVIRGGGVEATALHLPAGLEAESMIPSNTSWLVRATDGTTDGKKLIVMINPADGKALRIIRSPKMNINEITCVRDGDYYAIRLPTEENKKAFLMEAAP